MRTTGDIFPRQSAQNELAATRNKILVAAACDRELRGVPLSVLTILLMEYLHRKPGKDFGRMWPAVATIAAKIDASVRQVRRAFRLLRKKGLIRLVDKGCGRRASATYGIGGSVKTRTPMPAKGDTDVRKPRTPVSVKHDTDVRESVTPGSPNPIEHSSKEPKSKDAVAVIQQTAKAMAASTSPLSAHGRGIQPQDDTQIAFEELRGRMPAEEYVAFVNAYLGGDAETISRAKRVAEEVKSRDSSPKVGDSPA